MFKIQRPERVELHIMRIEAYILQKSFYLPTSICGSVLIYLILNNVNDKNRFPITIPIAESTRTYFLGRIASCHKGSVRKCICITNNVIDVVFGFRSFHSLSVERHSENSHGMTWLKNTSDDSFDIEVLIG